MPIALVIFTYLSTWPRSMSVNSCGDLLDERLGAVRVHRGLELRRGDDGDDLPVQAVDDGLGHVRRPHDAEPQRGLEPGIALFGNGRHVGQGGRARRACRRRSASPCRPSRSAAAPASSRRRRRRRPRGSRGRSRRCSCTGCAASRTSPRPSASPSTGASRCRCRRSRSSSCPPWLFASATKSESFAAGVLALVTSRYGVMATSEMCVKSFTGSYGSFEYAPAAMACVLVVPSVSV